MRHLFLGGPLDQQWRAVPPGQPVVVAQDMPGLPFGRGLAAVAKAMAADTGRIVHYRIAHVSLPGWVVPLAMFVAEGRRQTEVGDVLPGMVVGRGVERCTVPGNWMGHGHHTAVMHDAIRARGYRA